MICRSRIYAVVLAALVVSGCTAGGMTSEQRRFVLENYRERVRYMNAVVYYNRFEQHQSFHISGHPTRYHRYQVTNAAVWYPAGKQLVLYSKLVYTHDMGTGHFSVSPDDSVKKD